MKTKLTISILTVVFVWDFVAQPVLSMYGITLPVIDTENIVRLITVCAGLG